jgi:hypothetical protein
LLHLERSRSLERAHSDEQALTLIDIPRIEPVTPPAPPIAPETPVRTPRVVQLPQPAESSPITAPQTPGSSNAPRIDWHGELERAAKEQAAAVPDTALRLPCKGPRKFGDPPQTDCRPPPKLTEWVPEPSVFGFSGGLPFARLGKRCAIGLGFFACGIGELPKPNGDVFKSMDDPDRPRSSVPDSK